ncbi:MAG: Pr6Pr family membrane protein [Nitratireductor sp.]|nr:Pr6Pr family membrane protein [Nitratireductor sp.]
MAAFRLHRPVTWLGFGLGVFVLVLQFSLTVPLRLSQGDTFLGAVIFFFSFFTILTNLGVVLVYLSDLARGLPLGWFRRHETRALFAVLIAVVMGVYALVLAATWQPQGLFKLADIGLHYATPIVYLGWWLLMRPRGRIRFRRIPALLVSPLLYLAYVMVRGAMTGLYPYPFLQADTLGYGQVALNAVSLLVVTSLLLAAAIAVNNRMAEKDAVA